MLIPEPWMHVHGRQQSTWNPIYFVPSRLRTEILNEPFEALRVCCTTAEDLLGPNDWALFLSTSEEHRTAVQLDCCVSTHPDVLRPILAGGRKANVLFSVKEYLVPLDTELSWKIDVVSGMTIRDVYEQVIEAGLHKFEFTRNGFGHRHWIRSFIHHLSDSGFFVDQAQVAEAKESLRMIWPGGFDLPINEGLFY
ncbi:hypothetical protein N7467_005021 [Penicillium canescens]|nr:hypothetical protein N7467_005021 [Penicillium canescens]